MCMKNRNSKLTIVAGALCAAALLALNSGCGTGANLAGLSASVNVVQKGQVIGATISAGTNSITVGGSYAQGTNSYAGSVTAP
jgi:hypothetical protein